MRLTPLTACALVLMSPLAGVSHAQEAPANNASQKPEAGDPEAERRALNLQEAERARQQVAANEQSQSHHDAAAALTDMQVARDSARYDARLQRHEEAEQDYQARREAWERKNPACWKGDALRCPADPQASGG